MIRFIRKPPYLSQISNKGVFLIIIPLIGRLGQAPQPGSDGEVGMGGQTGCARGGFRVTVRVRFRVTVRVTVQRYRPCYLTTVVCSENRPKAGKRKVCLALVAFPVLSLALPITMRNALGQ